MSTVAPVDSLARPARTLTVEVVACAPAASDAVTLLLAVPGTEQAPAAYRPGQFITLSFAAGNTTLHRSYSLCGDGRPDTPWEITVKRQHGGMVSNYLYSRARPGMLLRSTLPRGSFTLPAARPDVPLVFVAGGSGITPIYGMLRALAQLAPARRPRVWLHYAYHAPAEAIYLQQLLALDPPRQWLTQVHYVGEQGQRLRADQVVASMGAAAPHAEWYVCGPAGLKRSVQATATLNGVPAERVHAEVFTSPVPRHADASGLGEQPARVRLADSGAILEARSGETLLETLERAGYRPDYDCRAGACGTCRLRLLAGSVRNGDGEGLTPAERAAGYTLACVAQPVGEVVLATAGERIAAPGRARTAAGGAAGRHSAARRGLRLGLAAAAAGLFLSMWGITSHSPKTPAASAGISLPSVSPPSFFSGDDGEGGANGGQGQSTGGSGAFTTQPGATVPNTSTGVS